MRQRTIRLISAASDRPESSAFPILAWIRRYDPSWSSGDIAAGLSVGSIIVAQGMAYAIIANLPPVHGLYASLVSLTLYGLLGTCGQLSVAPVAILALILREGAQKIVPHPLDSNYIHAAMTILLLAGCIQLILGLVGFSRITNKLISKPVLGGFTSASAMIIMASQLKMATGIQTKASDHFFEVIGSVVSNIDTIHPYTACMASGTIALLYLIQSYNKTNKKNIPAALVAVLVATTASYFFDLESIGIKTLGPVPTGLPSIKSISVSFHDLHVGWHAALAIALVSYIESISVAIKMEEKFGSKVNESQELFTLGVIHFCSALLRGLPVAGGLSRSAVTANSGARTPISSFVAAAVVLGAVLFLTDFIYFMPMNTLAAVVLIACSSLIDIHEGVVLYKNRQRSEFGIWLFSVLSTLLLGVENGIILSIIGSIIVLLYQFAEPKIATSWTENSLLADLEMGNSLPNNIFIVRVEGPLLFCNADTVRKSILDAASRFSDDKEKKILLLDLSRSFDVDSSSLNALQRVTNELFASNVALCVIGLSNPTLKERIRSLEHVSVLSSIAEAIEAVDTR